MCGMLPRGCAVRYHSYAIYYGRAVVLFNVFWSAANSSDFHIMHGGVPNVHWYRNIRRFASSRKPIGRI